MLTSSAEPVKVKTSQLNSLSSSASDMQVGDSAGGLGLSFTTAAALEGEASKVAVGAGARRFAAAGDEAVVAAAGAGLMSARKAVIDKAPACAAMMPRALGSSRGCTANVAVAVSADAGRTWRKGSDEAVGLVGGLLGSPPVTGSKRVVAMDSLAAAPAGAMPIA